MKKTQVIFLILILIAVGSFIYFHEGTQPFDREDTKAVAFTVSPGAPLQLIINDLAKNDLIRDRVVFYLVVKQLGLEKKIQAGDFRLSPSMNSYEIAKNLTHGTLDVSVTLIEGTRREEMAQVVSQTLGIPEVEFIAESKEGYLFPDTYFFPKNATAGAVIAVLENTMDTKLTPEILKKASQKGLNKNQLITMASIVEKEAREDRDRPVVAGILLKRLEAGWPLQVDATIQYAIGYQPAEKSWWKKYLSVDDLAIDSPFNSYKNGGLPPAPIANPGLKSIEAVANAETATPYWYYMSDKNGRMHYSKTIEEHDANVQKYLQ